MKTFIKVQDGFNIYFENLPEDISLLELLPEESEDELKRISDTMEIFTAKVSAEKAGIELGTDYLGGCIYNDIDDFYKDDYFNDMVNNAINEAKKQLPNLIKELTQ